jgi:dipeptidyl aminopeptidase/acylaminoacyl peptidase
MVTWRSGDNTEVHGQLLAPAADGKKHAAVIFIHGGPVRQMVPAWHYMGFYHFTYAFNQWLALHGWVVLMPNYRGGIGYGRAFRRPDHFSWLGAVEYNDLVSAAKWLRARDDVDGKRIAVWGGSYGGLMTAMGLARNSDLFAAGVDFAGVHDWSQIFPGRGEPVRKLSWNSSPVARVAGWRSPVLFIHGDDDNNVDVQQTIDLIERLRDKGNVEVQTLALPDEVHFMLWHRNWVSMMYTAFDFLHRHLD